MADQLKLYVIESMGFAARLTAEDDLQLIRRDMNDFCEGRGDSAPIPASLFYSLTQWCRSNDVSKLIASNASNPSPNEETDNEANWNKVKEHLRIEGEPPVHFDRYQEAILRFLSFYVRPEQVDPNTSAPASTSSTSTSQASNAPPVPAATNSTSASQANNGPAATASTNSTSTSQGSNAPQALASTPVPSHAEVSTAPTPLCNGYHRSLME